MLDWWGPDGRFSLLALVLLGVPAIAAIVFMIFRLAHRLDRQILRRWQRLDPQPGPAIDPRTLGFLLLIIGVVLCAIGVVMAVFVQSPRLADLAPSVLFSGFSCGYGAALLRPWGDTARVAADAGSPIVGKQGLE
jgi:hypothetical protein